MMVKGKKTNEWHDKFETTKRKIAGLKNQLGKFKKN